MKKNNKNGIVYSTNPDLMRQTDEETEKDYLPADQQRIIIRLDKKQRAGKVVTLISGFDADRSKIELIGKDLKKYCGTGGTVEDNEVLIQGDIREKAQQWLRKNGYKNIKVI